MNRFSPHFLSLARHGSCGEGKFESGHSVTLWRAEPGSRAGPLSPPPAGLKCINCAMRVGWMLQNQPFEPRLGAMRFCLRTERFIPDIAQLRAWRSMIQQVLRNLLDFRLNSFIKRVVWCHG